MASASVCERNPFRGLGLLERLVHQRLRAIQVSIAKADLCAYLLLGGLELQGPQFFQGYPTAQVKNLYPNHTPLGIEIKNNTRLHFLRFDNR